MARSLAALTMAALFSQSLGFFAPPGASAHAVQGALETESATVPASTQRVEPLRCPGELRLVASVVNERRPQLSLAVVRNGGGARVLPIGGRLDDLVLVELRPHYAGLRTAKGGFCVLPVFDSNRASAHTAASTPGDAPKPPVVISKADPNKPRAMFTPEELQHGLRSLGNGEYALTKELLLKALKNPGGAVGGAHFRMVERHGRTLGMEVRAVRDGSALQRMGVRSGDIVQSINGIDVSTPLGLLDALRTAREADSLTLSIVREGRVRALRYLVE